MFRVRSTDSESKGGYFGKVRVKRKRAATLKSVKPQEVNSLVQTPRSDNRAPGNRLRECVQRLKTLENDIQFTRVCEDATFGTRVSIGTSYKTIADVDDGLEIERQHAENTHFFVKIQIPESMQQFQDKQKLDQFFKFMSHDILASVELKFRIFPQQRKSEHLGW